MEKQYLQTTYSLKLLKTAALVILATVAMLDFCTIANVMDLKWFTDLSCLVRLEVQRSLEDLWDPSVLELLLLQLAQVSQEVLPVRGYQGRQGQLAFSEALS